MFIHEFLCPEGEVGKRNLSRKEIEDNLVSRKTTHKTKKQKNRHWIRTWLEDDWG